MRKKTGKEKAPEEAVKIQFDPVNEAVLIAAVVADERARKLYLESIPGDYFTGDGHEAMWETLRDLFSRGLEYSVEAVRSLAGEKFDCNVLDEYVRARPHAPPNIKHHAELVRWHRARRDALKGPVTEFLDLFKDPSSEPARVSALAVRVKEAFSGHGDTRHLLNSKQLVEEHALELDRRMRGEALFPYGLPGLDRFGPEDYEERDGQRVELDGKHRIIPGAEPGGITVVVGRSGSGKSTGLANIILSMANEGRRVMWGAWEQGHANALELAACLQLEMSRPAIRTGRFNKADRDELLAEMERIGRYVQMLRIPFNRNASSDRKYNRDNLNILNQYVAESGCDVAVFDLFHMSLEQSDPDEVTRALYRMGDIAKENRAHVVLVHQLRKDLEVSGDPRPTRESISGVGSWIDVADTCLAFHRPGVYGGTDDKIEVHVLKQRDGAWPLAVEFDWDGQYGSITNGRTLVVAKPGERTAMDDFLGDAKPAGRKSNRRRRA